MDEQRVEGAGRLPLVLCSWSREAAGRPTLILHGYLEQGAAWDAVATQLPGPVHAPDHRGHGRSGHVGTGGFYHFWDYVSDVDAVVEHLGGKVHLVGHSMGGTIACLYAGARPSAVDRLVLVEGLGPPDLTSLSVGRSRSFLKQRREPPVHKVLADLDDAVLRMKRFNPRLDDALARRLAARITEPVDGGLRWTWDPLHRATNPNPFDPRQFERWVRAIESPTLYIHGADSPFRVPDLDERYSWLARARRVDVDGAGHLIHHDAPDALAALIREFLSE